MFYRKLKNARYIERDKRSSRIVMWKCDQFTNIIYKHRCENALYFAVKTLKEIFYYILKAVKFAGEVVEKITRLVIQTTNELKKVFTCRQMVFSHDLHGDFTRNQYFGFSH